MVPGGAAGVAAVLLVACASGSDSSSSTATGARLQTGPPRTYLLMLDDLPLPGFTVVAAPAPLIVDELAAGDGLRAQRFRADGFQAAARARYFRPVPDLATSNGPVDVISTVVRFASVAGAMSAFATEAQHQDSLSGAIPLSTGPLGDQGHGDLLTAQTGGVTVADTVLVWRTANLLSILETHERLAGSPLAHALTVAGPQVARQGGATPLPQ